MARSSNRLPERFPLGSKYVVEGYGSLVRRYIELPNGHKIILRTRKATVCSCAVIRTDSIVPNLSGNVQNFFIV